MDINPEFKIIVHIGSKRVVINVTNAIRASNGNLEFCASIASDNPYTRGYHGIGPTPTDAVEALYNLLGRRYRK